MKTFGIFFLLGCLFLGAGPAAALPTQDLWIPQTETLASGHWRIDMQSQFSPDKRTGDVSAQYHQSSFGLGFGLFQKGWVGIEGGFDWKEPAAGSVEEGIFGNIRVRVNDWEKAGWSIAFGAHSIGFKPEVSDINLLYFMLQNNIGMNWSTGIGAYTGSTDLLVNSKGQDDSKGVLVGLWKTLRGGRLGLEWQSGQNHLGYIFLGLKSRLHDDVSGCLGYGVATNKESHRDWVLFRISVGF